MEFNNNADAREPEQNKDQEQASGSVEPEPEPEEEKCEVQLMYEVRHPRVPPNYDQEADALLPGNNYVVKPLLWRAPLGQQLTPVEAMAARLRFEQNHYEQYRQDKEEKREADARAAARVALNAQGLRQFPYRGFGVPDNMPPPPRD